MTGSGKKILLSEESLKRRNNWKSENSLTESGGGYCFFREVHSYIVDQLIVDDILKSRRRTGVSTLEKIRQHRDTDCPKA